MFDGKKLPLFWYNKSITEANEKYICSQQIGIGICKALFYSEGLETYIYSSGQKIFSSYKMLLLTCPLTGTIRNTSESSGGCLR
jgi:hypothetical protein